jgi:membrane fusion protein
VASLFRPEVLEHRQRDWLGSIQLIRPVSLAVLTAFVVVSAAAVVAYLVLGEYTRKARVSGFLVPDRGVIRLLSPQPATVLESRAAEGASVRAGDVLFVLPASAASSERRVNAARSSRTSSRPSTARSTTCGASSARWPPRPICNESG